MSCVCATKVIINILNIVCMVLGLAIAAASIWFFVQIHEFTSLRNKNHYILDYTVYWPQAVPWIFFVAAVFILSVSCCGFTSIRTNKRKLILIYAIFLGTVIVCLIAAAAMALILADDIATENFIKDIAWDVFSQSKTDKDVAESFEVIQRKLHCCGVGSPRDYMTWKDEFPMSCCDGYNHGWQEPYVSDCKSTNKFANERHGCAAVAAQYAGIATKVISGATVFTAVVEVMILVAVMIHF